MKTGDRSEIMKNIIEVQDFVKKYDKFTAVDNVTFEAEEGSIFAFLGPNGAGKSTTIHYVPYSIRPLEPRS